MSRKHRGQFRGDPVTYQTPLPAGGVKLETFIPWTLIKRGIKKQIITPIDAPQEFLEEAARERQLREKSKDTPLIRALGLAHHWQRLLDTGLVASITDLATQEGMDRGQVSKMVQLARLAPDLIEVCLNGGAPGLSLERLIRRSIPISWEDQRHQCHRD